MIYIITILHYIIIIQNNIVIFFLLFIKSFGLLKALFLGDFKVVFFNDIMCKQQELLIVFGIFGSPEKD